MPTYKPVDSQIDPDAPELQPDVAAAPQASPFTDEGQIPPVAEDAQAQAAPTASDQAYGDAPAIDQGMWEPAPFRAACERAGKLDRWDDRYAAGYTAATQWIQPYEGREAFEWHLKKGESASDALRDFIRGPTIADYRAIGVALEMDELRDYLGDQRFDRLFGSRDGDTDAAIPVAQRLQITSAMYTIPFVDQMKAIAADAEAKLAVPIEPVTATDVAERENKADEEEVPVVPVAVVEEEPNREVV